MPKECKYVVFGLLSPSPTPHFSIDHFEYCDRNRLENRDNVLTQLERARALNPEMTSFESWVGQQTGEGKGSRKDWNKVSFWKLITGRS